MSLLRFEEEWGEGGGGGEGVKWTEWTEKAESKNYGSGRIVHNKLNDPEQAYSDWHLSIVSSRKGDTQLRRRRMMMMTMMIIMMICK